MQKKNTVTIIPNFKLNTRNKKKWTSIVHKLRGNCFVLFIRSFWNVTDRRSERYAAVQRSYRINESACCPIDSPFVVTFFGRWPTIGGRKKKKKFENACWKKKGRGPLFDKPTNLFVHSRQINRCTPGFVTTVD